MSTKTLAAEMANLDGGRGHGIVRKARRRSIIRYVLIVMMTVAWLGAIGIGIRKVQSFESTPGSLGSTPRLWPPDSSVVPDSGRSTLVMLVHSQCSCSGASLAELAQVMAKTHARANAWVLFEQRGDSLDTRTWAQAHRIPGITVGIDQDGAEARRFGALTSGHVVVYDSAGLLVFSGGITAARGHEGENQGRNQLIDAVNGVSASPSVHSVFGCSFD
jgi:hypothetical protein